MPGHPFDRPPDSLHGRRNRREVRYHDVPQLRPDNPQRAVEIAPCHIRPLPYDVSTKVPGFLANEYHEAQEINSEKKETQSLDRRDDVGRHSHLFNQIGEVVERHRRASNEGEQNDTYNCMEGEPSHQFYLGRNGSVSPKAETGRPLPITLWNLTTR